MKKKLILMGFAGVLVISTIIGGTLAAFRANSSQGTSKITTKNIDIHIQKNDTNEFDQYTTGMINAMPGTVINTDLKIAFDSSNNYDSYVRAIVNKAWWKKDATGSLEKVFDDSLDLAAIEIIPENQEDWIIIDQDAETVVMYYKYPLSDTNSLFQSETSDFVDRIKISEVIGNDYANKSFQVEATVDAVQISQGAEAIKSAWGVQAFLGADGTIQEIAVE